MTLPSSQPFVNNAIGMAEPLLTKSISSVATGLVPSLGVPSGGSMIPIPSITGGAGGSAGPSNASNYSPFTGGTINVNSPGAGGSGSISTIVFWGVIAGGAFLLWKTLRR